VTHRAYRSLNEPVKLAGFTGLQWLALLLTGALVIGATQLVGLAARPAISVCALVITTVAACAYAAEPGGVQPVLLLADALRMLARPRHYQAGMASVGDRPALGVQITSPAPVGERVG
jgi:hypothetical protein